MPSWPDPQLGNYGRNEWAIVGAPCVLIKALADKVISALSPRYKCAYADTSTMMKLALRPAGCLAVLLWSIPTRSTISSLIIIRRLTPF